MPQMRRAENTRASRPLISVVLPVYNSAATIRDTVESVLQQTFGDFELLVIDDGSTDDTLRIVGDASDDRFRVFSFENSGPAAARNKGITRASGEFVAFIDSDDLWVPEKLELQAAALIENPSAGLVYSWVDYINESDRVLNFGSRTRVEGDAYKQLLTGNFLDCGSNPLVRREVFDRVGMFDETVIGAEDWDMWLRIAHEYPFAHVPAVHVFYRIRTETVSSSIRRQEAECIKVLETGLARLPASPEKDRIRQVGERNLYQYFTARVAQTATGPGRFTLAMGYLREFWGRTPSRLRDAPQALVLFIKIVIVSILPGRSSRILLGAIGFLRGRHRKVVVFPGRPN